MKFKAVIFDLDGTLLNTLDDLADGVNYALRQFSYPERTLEEIRIFLGNGARNLVFRSLPEDKKDTIDTVLPVFKAYYSEHSMIKTAPYSGIVDMLKTLKANGIRTAIVSNKYDLAVKQLSQDVFGELIDIAIGEGNGISIKPNPDGVFAAIKTLGVNAEDCIYVGDSDTDIMTARNAGIPCISVTWGFRDEELFRSVGTDYVAHNVKELFDIINGD